MDRETAKRVALEYLDASQGVACAIIALHAVETRSHWFFVWNTREAVTTSGRKGALVGVGPVAVEKATGLARVLPRISGGILGGSVEPLLPVPTQVASVDEARARAQAVIDLSSEHLCTVRDVCTRPYGWVFSVQTDEFLRTGDPSAQLVGNGPLVVEAKDGAVHSLESAYSLADALTRFEHKHGYLL